MTKKLKMKAVMTSVATSQHEQLIEKAFNAGLSVSAYVRNLIYTDLKQKG